MKNILALTLAALLLAPAHARDHTDLDEKSAEKLLQECEKDQLDSCVTLALWLRDVMEAPASAYEPLKKACDGGNMKGCNVLGNLYLDPYSGLGMDQKQAKALYEKACSGGYANACTNLRGLKEEKATTPAEDDNAKQARLQSLYNSCMMENDAACAALQREMERQPAAGGQQRKEQQRKEKPSRLDK